MTNRKRNVFTGFISSISTSFILQLVSLLIIPFYLKLTSQELFGLWLTLGAILGWIKIGDMFTRTFSYKKIYNGFRENKLFAFKKLYMGNDIYHNCSWFINIHSRFHIYRQHNKFTLYKRRFNR